MNAFNVWSLTDLADPQRLAVVVARTPACVNVSGWSYHGGKRRGLIIHAPTDASQPPRVEIGSGPEAVPAPILHYAAARGSVACINVALDFGADASLKIAGYTPDAIAAAVGAAPAADTIRAAARLQQNPHIACEEGEKVTRGMIVQSEHDAWSALRTHFEDGVATVEIEFREGFGQPNSVHTLHVPRLSSSKHFLAKLERLFDQRLTVSFPIAKEEIRTIHRLPVLATTAPLPTPNGGEPDDDSDDDVVAPRGFSAGGAKNASGGSSTAASVVATRMLTVNSRTIPYLLHMQYPRCIARPFLPGTRPPPPLSASAMETLRSYSPTPSRGQTPAAAASRSGASPNQTTATGGRDSRLSTATSGTRRSSLSLRMESLTRELHEARERQRGPTISGLDAIDERPKKKGRASRDGALSPTQTRLEDMKLLVQAAERKINPPASASVKKLPGEAIQELTERLSTMAAKDIRAKREAHEAYLMERCEQLWRTGPKRAAEGGDEDEG